MQTFYIDFRGWCDISAETREEAERLFWEYMQAPSSRCRNEQYEIESISDTASEGQIEKFLF